MDVSELTVLILPGFFRRNRLHHIPMFGYFPIRIESEYIESDLFTGTGKIIDRLQKNLVPVFKSTDIVHCGFHRSGSQPGNTSDKCFCTGAISQVMLNITSRQKFFRRGSVAGSECSNQSQSFFFVCHNFYILSFVVTAYVTSNKVSIT